MYTHMYNYTYTTYTCTTVHVHSTCRHICIIIQHVHVHLHTTVHATGKSLISIPLVAIATDAHNTATERTLPQSSKTNKLMSICNFGNVTLTRKLPN